MSIQNANIIFSRIGIIFFSDAGNAILRSIFRKVSEEEFHICRKKKYHLYRTYRKHHISMYVLRKIIFNFPSMEKLSYSIFRKEMPSLLMIQERSYSSAVFLERPSFQNIWRIYLISMCFFLGKIIFLFRPKE